MELLIKDFGFTLTESKVASILCQMYGVPVDKLKVVTVSEPSRFEMFKEYQVTVTIRQSDVWILVPQVADIFRKLDYQVWVGIDTNNGHSLNFKPLIVAPLTGFSVGSYIHTDTFCEYYINKERSGNALARLEVDSKRLVLYFYENNDFHQLDLNMHTDLLKECIVDMEEGQVTIYIPYKLVPRLAKVLPLSLRRKTVVPDVASIENIKYDFNMERVTSAGRLESSILGESNCLKIRFDKDKYKSVIEGFYSAGLKIFFTSVTATESQPVRGSELLTKYKSCITSFSDHWAFKVIVSRGMHVCEQLKRIPDLDIKFKRLQEKNSFERCLNQIADILETGKLIDLSKALDYFIGLDDNQTEEEIEGLSYTRRILITPTRHMYFPPECMINNRVLRDYSPDFAVRVSFKDDNMQLLSNVRSREFISEVVEAPLENGFHVGKRHYEFLAASNSQLKAHGVWFYARDEDGHDAHFIRENMGDLTNIKCVASYVSRMGQCFSATEDSIEVTMDSKTDVQIDEPDIEVGQYKFSDGTGRISHSLAQQVARETGRKSVNSVYQIRYGGCKGTVALDPTLTGDALFIRKSMCKFESDHKRLEIANVSKPCPLFLNHSAIMLLNDHGVPTKVFQDLQSMMIQELTGMFYDNDKAADSLSKRTQVTIGFRKLAKSGFSLISDPLFREMLFAVMESKMRDIKDRARIELPASHARNMIGAMDETSTLHYGQVFIQYTENIKSKKGSKKILEGDVIVTKFPALHQGDIRRFTAVDVQDLHHMVDCIVFPSKGKRPHPNEMSGSDLDGDEYFVTWLPELLDHFPENNSSPMDFPPSKKIELYRDVKLSDLIQFIIDYIHNDRLGLIANAHKAHADEKGIFSEICQRLAKKHSEAVDFAKTGHCPDLEKSERVETYPDFMGKHGKSNVRQSKKALGDLFRESRKIVNIIPKDDETLVKNGLYKLDQNLSEGADQDCELGAKEEFKRYQSKIQELMTRFGIESEAEMLSGCIRRLHLRLSQQNEKFEVVQIVNKQIKALFQTYRGYFFKEFGGEEEVDLANPSSQMLKKAATWYKVAYTSGDKIGRSLPWVVWDLISNFCSGQVSEVGNPVFQAISDSMVKAVKHQEFNPRSHVLLCIRLWAKHEKLPDDELHDLYVLFFQGYQFDGRGLTLVNFFNWASSQECSQRVQLACQRAFFSLVLAADFNRLMGRHSNQYMETSLIIPERVWDSYRRHGLESFANKMQKNYEATISIRPNRKWKYPNGTIFVHANSNVLFEIEQKLIQYINA